MILKTDLYILVQTELPVISVTDYCVREMEVTQEMNLLSVKILNNVTPVVAYEF